MLTDEMIVQIGEEVAAQSIKAQKSPYLAILKKALSQAKKAQERLLIALEKGQEAETLLDRIGQRREEIEQIETQLAKETLAADHLTEPEILFFLKSLQAGSINSLKYRKALIALFINRIYVYDERYTVFFNTKDRPTEITSELINMTKGSGGGIRGSTGDHFGVPQSV